MLVEKLFKLGNIAILVIDFHLYSFEPCSCITKVTTLINIQNKY